MEEPALNKIIVQEALRILLKEKTNSQKEILLKLKALDTKISQATINNLITGKRSVTNRMINSITSGFCTLLKKEFCLRFNESTHKFEKIMEEECTPQAILTKKQSTQSTPNKSDRGYVIYDGRLDYHEKLDFYDEAKFEVIELGIRLRNFKNYFTEKRESAFKTPIEKLLKKGINFKCYVLNPSGNIAQRYVADRALAQFSEKKILESLPLIKEELRKLFVEMNKRNYRGKMELYEYDHFPYYHASVIDGNQPNGKMWIAPYLYGVSRRNTPVIELSHQQSKILYKRYWRSVKTMIESTQVQSLL